MVVGVSVLDLLALGTLGPPYLQRGLLAATLIAVPAGVVGVHVRLRKRAFVTDALTHTVFPGLALAVVFQASLFVGALVAAGVSLVFLAALSHRRRGGDDDVLAVVLAGFFAVGVAVVSRSDSFTADLTALLFGRILTVDTTDLAQMAAAGGLAMALVAALHKELVLRAFDPSASAAAGYRPGVLDLALDVAVALVVVTGFKAVGTLLVVALVVTPAVAAGLCASSVRGALVVSVTVGVAAGWAGLGLSVVASRRGLVLPPGATIVAVLSAGFLAVLATTSWRARFRPLARPS